MKLTKAKLLEILDDIDDNDEVVLISAPDSRHPITYHLDASRSGQYADKVYLVEGPQIERTDSEIRNAFQLGY